MSDVLLNARNDIADMEMAAFIGETLEKHYPGWGWQVELPAHDVAVIRNLKLSEAIRKQEGNNRPYGFAVHLDTTPDDVRRKVVHAGGALLERGHQSATGWTESKQITKVDM